MRSHTEASLPQITSVPNLPSFTQLSVHEFESNPRKAEALRVHKQTKFMQAKKKLSEVVDSMYKLKAGLEDPDLLPIDG